MSTTPIFKHFAAVRAFADLSGEEQAAIAALSTDDRKKLSDWWNPSQRQMAEAQLTPLVRLVSEIHLRRPYLVVTLPSDDTSAACIVEYAGEPLMLFDGFTRDGNRADGERFDVIDAVDSLEHEIGDDRGAFDPNADDPMFSHAHLIGRVAAAVKDGTIDILDVGESIRDEVKQVLATEA